MATRDEVIKLTYLVTGNDEIAKSAGELVELGKSGKVAEEDIDQFTKALKKLADESAQLKNSLSLKAALKETSDNLKLAESNLISLNAQYAKAGNTSKEVAAQYKKAEEAVIALTAQQRQQELALTKATGALQKAGIDTNNLAAANLKLQQDSAQLAGQIGQISQNATKAAEAERLAAEGTKNLASESKNAGGLISELKSHLLEIVSAAVAVELALKGIEFGTDAVKEASQVEASISRLKALAGTLPGSFDAFEEQLTKAERQTNSTSKEAADALAALAAQGQKTDEAFQSLVPTLLLAKIGAIDVAQAAAIVDDTLDQFGLSAENAAHVVDVLTVASKGSKEGLAGISEGLSKLSPLARAIGLSFEQTAGLLGLMTQNGISAQAATKGLSAIFADLQDPTSKLRVDLLGLGDGTNNFSAAVKALTGPGEQANRALLNLDGTARKVILFLQQQGPEAVEKFAAGLEHVDGAASETFKILNDNLKGSLSGFGNAIDRISKDLAQPLLAPLNSELVKLSKALDDFAQSKSFEELKGEFSNLFTNAVDGFDKVIQDIDWKKLVENGKEAVAELSNNLHTFADDAHVIAEGINAVTSAVTQIVKASTTTLDLLTAGPTRRLADQLTGGLTDIAQKATEEFQGIVDSFKSSADSLAENLNADKLVSDAAQKMVAGFGEAVTETAGKLDNSIPAIQRFADRLGTVPDYTRDASDGFRNLGPSADIAADGLDKVSNAAIKIGGGPLQDAKKALEDAEQALADLEKSGTASGREIDVASRLVQQAAVRYESLKVSTEKAASGAEALITAFTDLKIQSAASLQEAANTAKTAFETIDRGSAQTAAGLADRQNAFLAYAETALKAAAAANDGSLAQVESLLNAQAATLKVGDALDKLVDKYEKVGNASGSAGNQAADSFNRAASAGKGAADSAGDAGNKIEKAGDKTKDAADKAEEGTGRIKDFTIQMQGFGEGAVKALNEVTAAAGQNLIGGGAAGFQAYIRALDTGFRSVEARLAAQKSVAAEVQSSYTQLSDAAIESMAKVRGGYDAAAASFSGLADAARNGVGEFALLDQSDLSQLSSAAEGIAQRIRQIGQEAADARRSLEDLTKSLQDQADQRAGNQAGIEDRRYQEQLRQIDELAKKGGEAAIQQANQARELARKEHEAKLKDIEDEEKKRIASNNKSAASSNKQSSTQPQPKGGGNGGASATAYQNGASFTVNIATFNHLNPGDNKSLADQMVRYLQPAFASFNLRSR